MNQPLSWGRLAAVLLLSSPLLAFAADPKFPPDTDPTLIPYAAEPLLAEVSPGRAIHLVCMGQGSPTVIFTAGLGNWSEIWRKVQPSIAETTRACAWDRAGFGLSSPSPQPQDVTHTTADLEKALKVAHIGGPYVIVGHSLGGYESLLFTDRHLREVVGMVLVDPSFPDQQRIIAETSPITATTTGQLARDAISSLQACAAKLKTGQTKPGDADFADCVDPSEDTYPAGLLARFRAMESDPARYVTVASTIGQGPKDSVLAINPRRHYADMPLIVLTAGEIQDFPPEAQEAGKAWAEFVATGWLKAHDDIARLSERGVNLVVPDSAHYIHMQKPQIVIDSINQVVDEVRQKNRR